LGLEAFVTSLVMTSLTSRFGDQSWSKLVTGHDKKLNFLKTGHQIDWSGAGHDQTGHKSLKTRNF